MPRAIALFLILISMLLGGACYLWWPIAVFCYVEVGSLIWLICEGSIIWWRSALLWYPAMLFDRPGWLD